MLDVRYPLALRTSPVLMAVCLIILPAQAQYSGGTGEPNDPYQIALAADLIPFGDVALPSQATDAGTAEWPTTEPGPFVRTLGIPPDLLPDPLLVAADECTMLADGKQCRVPQPSEKIRTVQTLLLDLSEEGAAWIFNEVVPRGQGPHGMAFSASSVVPPAGEYVVVVVQYEGEIPLSHGSYSYSYGLPFDADGIASNNYVPLAQYPYDFFTGTDLWYQLNYTPAGGYQLTLTDVRRNLARTATKARVLIAGSEMAWFIPRTEVEPPSRAHRQAVGYGPLSATGDTLTLMVRVTVHCWLQNWGLDGTFWSACLWPVVGDPLAEVPATAISLTGSPPAGEPPVMSHPCDGMDGVWMKTSLICSEVDGAESYYYHIGTDPDAVLIADENTPGVVQSSTWWTENPGFEPGTTYYIKVGCRRAGDGPVYWSHVTSFTTADLSDPGVVFSAPVIATVAPPSLCPDDCPSDPGIVPSTGTGPVIQWVGSLLDFGLDAEPCGPGTGWLTWEGVVTPPSEGSYTFSAEGNNGAEVRLNDVPILGPDVGLSATFDLCPQPYSISGHASGPGAWIGVIGTPLDDPDAFRPPSIAVPKDMPVPTDLGPAGTVDLAWDVFTTTESDNMLGIVYLDQDRQKVVVRADEAMVGVAETDSVSVPNLLPGATYYYATDTFSACPPYSLYPGLIGTFTTGSTQVVDDFTGPSAWHVGYYRFSDWGGYEPSGVRSEADTGDDGLVVPYGPFFPVKVERRYFWSVVNMSAHDALEIDFSGAAGSGPAYVTVHFEDIHGNVGLANLTDPGGEALQSGECQTRRIDLAELATSGPLDLANVCCLYVDIEPIDVPDGDAAGGTLRIHEIRLVRTPKWEGGTIVLNLGANDWEDQAGSDGVDVTSDPGLWHAFGATPEGSDGVFVGQLDQSGETILRFNLARLGLPRSADDPGASPTGTIVYDFDVQCSLEGAGASAIVRIDGRSVLTLPGPVTDGQYNIPLREPPTTVEFQLANRGDSRVTLTIDKAEVESVVPDLEGVVVLCSLR